MPDSITATPPSAAELAGLLADLKLQIEYQAPGALVAFGRKTRTHLSKKIELMVAVIREFGFIVPVILDENGRILAGNARVDAARRLGLSSIPTVRLSHLTAEQKRAYAIADNRLAELAGWDRDTLKLEFEELAAIDLDFEIELTGFTEPQIDAIVIDSGNDEKAGNVVPTLPERPVSQIGDLWLMGEHQLYCGDATLAGSLDVVLGGRKVRTVFTDPPYNVRVEGHVTSSRAHGEFVMASGEMSDPEFTAFLEKVWLRISENLLPGGLAYLCMDWRHMRHTIAAADPAQLELLNLIVWDKTAGGMGSFYRSRHELVFLMKKPGASHSNRVALGSNGRDRSNVWAYAGVNGFGAGKAKSRDLHPTVKPLALVRDAILDSSARGEVVLDLFSGSGTTIIACEATKRLGRALELDPRYADTGVIRWQDYTGQEATLAETGESFGAVRARRAGAMTEAA